MARGGWLVAFEGDLIAEGVLHQTYEEALLAARRRRLGGARLYFVCEGLPNGRDPAPLLDAALRGGVDVIQLREKAPRCAEEVVSLAEPFARAARDHGALFFLNDMPELVEACGADGVHVGQDDDPVAVARGTGAERAGRPLDPHARAVRRRARRRRRRRLGPDQRRAGLGDADQGGPPRCRPGW